MATLFPVLQFFNDDGTPLNGGKIYTYISGDSVLKNSFTSQSEGTIAANPIVLDANGRTTGIWLNGAYRIKVFKPDGVTQVGSTLDVLNEYNPVDWTGLTASISDINGYAAAVGTAGTVVASKSVVVNASKNIGTFGSLTAGKLIANTSVQAPVINDANAVAALTIAATASQVNALTLTPSATGNAVALAATGSDNNIGLNINSKGTSPISLNSWTFPTTDGTNGQFLSTNGAKALSFTSPTGLQQVQSSYLHTLQTITTVLPYDNTIPQNTEGDQVLSLAITPKSATSTLHISVAVTAGSNSTSRVVGAALFQDATAGALAASADSNSVNFKHTMTSGTTSSTTFNVRVGPSAAGTVYVNGTTGGVQLYGGVCNSSITIWEVL